MTQLFTRTLSTVALFAAVGCTEPNPAFNPDPYLPGECRLGIETTETFDQFGRPGKLDILFVMDNTGEVDALQEVVANSVSLFGSYLDEQEIDTRFAVTTTTSNGELAGPGRRGPDCEDNDTVVADLAESDWASVVRCNLLLGSEDPAFDAPLTAVDELIAAGEQDDFMRDDARLLVIVATKSDDCSATGSLSGDPTNGCAGESNLVDPTETVEAWRTRGEALDEMGFVVFGGPPSRLSNEAGRPVCSSTVGSVLPANRLARAAGAFSEQGFFFSACTDDITAPLAEALDGFVANGAVTICPSETLAHEPLSVLRTTDDGEEAVPFGEDGFVFMGPIPLCEEGAIRFDADAVREAEELRIDYCTIP